MNDCRYICRDDPGIVLIYTDGACLDNGKSNPRAGWAFVHGPGLAEKPAIASGRLEMKGPFGDDAPQTSNRAELRAVIAALGFRRWDGEGFSTIVFATDSEYVVEGSTKWARTWVSNGWKTSSGAAVKNKDLWEALLGEFEMSQAEGVSVKFWRIPRALNTVADAEAKKAAAKEGTPEQWTDMMGLCI